MSEPTPAGRYPRQDCDICHFPVAVVRMQHHMLICTNRNEEQRKTAFLRRQYADAAATARKLRRPPKGIGRPKRQPTLFPTKPAPSLNGKSLITMTVKIPFSDFVKILPLITKVAIA